MGSQRGVRRRRCDGGLTAGLRPDGAGAEQVPERISTCIMEERVRIAIPDLVPPHVFSDASLLQVLTRKATRLATKAWRQQYDQQLEPDELELQGPLTCKLPDGRECVMEGWRCETTGDTLRFFGPDGEEHNDLEHAREAYRRGDVAASLAALTTIVRRLEEKEAEQSSTLSSLLSRSSSNAKHMTSDQPDDWLHRADDPILQPMGLLVYSTSSGATKS